MTQTLSRRGYLIISTSFAVLGLAALTVGLFYLFVYVHINYLADILFNSALWVVGVLVLLKRYMKRIALKSNGK